MEIQESSSALIRTAKDPGGMGAEASALSAAEGAAEVGLAVVGRLVPVCPEDCATEEDGVCADVWDEAEVCGLVAATWGGALAGEGSGRVDCGD